MFQAFVLLKSTCLNVWMVLISVDNGHQKYHIKGNFCFLCILCHLKAKKINESWLQKCIHRLRNNIQNYQCPQHQIKTIAEHFEVSLRPQKQNSDRTCADINACGLLRTFFRISWGYFFADVRSSVQVSLRTSAKACVKFWLCFFLLRTCADILDLEKIRHWSKLHVRINSCGHLRTSEILSYTFWTING